MELLILILLSVLVILMYSSEFFNGSVDSGI